MKLLETLKGEHEGKVYCGEIYECDDPQNLTPIRQIQAVAFAQVEGDINVIFFKHVNGHIGCPGGGIEPQESLEDALSREILVEINCRMLSWGLTGIVEKVWKEGKPKTAGYHVRSWAKVELLAGKINDPCRKALERIVVPIDNAVYEKTQLQPVI